MTYWGLWVIAAAVFTIAELVTLALYMAPFALGSLAALAAGGFGAPLWLQVLVFGVSSILLVFALRPLARRHAAKPILTGPAALVGTEGIATTSIDSRDGRVRIAGGEWSARSEHEIHADSKVVVERIEGATLIVKASHPNQQGE